MTLLFHGSPNLFEALDPQSSHLLDDESVVFGTPIFEVAAIFGVRWSDRDFSFGTDDGTVFELREQRIGAFDEIFHEKVVSFVYTIDDANLFHDDVRLGMRPYEVVCNSIANWRCVEIVRVRRRILASNRIRFVAFDSA